VKLKRPTIDTDLMDTEARRLLKLFDAHAVVILVARDRGGWNECAMGSTHGCPLSTMEMMNDAARELLETYPRGCACHDVSWAAWRAGQIEDERDLH
jgi:hypothetical protein